MEYHYSLIRLYFMIICILHTSNCLNFWNLHGWVTHFARSFLLPQILKIKYPAKKTQHNETKAIKKRNQNNKQEENVKQLKEK